MKPEAANTPRDTGRLINVTRADGLTREIRVLDGHLFVCRGCCCGQVEKGFPAAPIEEFKREWKERGIRRRIHLTVSGCLGPCPLANVVLVLFGGQSLWFHSINSASHVTAIYDYLETMLRAERYLAPIGLLAECHFNRYVVDTDRGVLK